MLEGDVCTGGSHATVWGSIKGEEAGGEGG